MNKEVSDNKTKAGAGPKKNIESQTATPTKESNLKNFQIGLIASFALTAIVFIISIVVMTGMESRLADLEDEVFYLENKVSSLETDNDNLQSDIFDTYDFVSGEIDNVQDCINDFIDVWAERGSYALYCR